MNAPLLRTRDVLHLQSVERVSGLAFTLLEGFIERRGGSEVLREVLRRSGNDTAVPWVGPLHYPMAEFTALVNAACTALDYRPRELILDAARYSAPQLLKRYPTLSEGCDGPRALLLALPYGLHAELSHVVTFLKAAHFEVWPHGDDGIAVHYRSSRRWCWLIQGLLSGIADHYAVPARLSHAVCALQGATLCRYELRFGQEEE